MKKSVLIFNILLLLFFLSYGNQNKDKKLKNKRLIELIQFPKHVLKLKKLKTQTIKIEKKYYDKHERNYYLICRNVNQKYQKAIFYVHGGGWIVGKPENHLKLAELLSSQGYLVILTAYRYAHQTHGLEIMEDVKKSYQKACEQIKEEYPEIESIIIGGASAGGNLASLLALSNVESLIPIKGLFSLSGVLDLTEIPYNFVVKKFANEPHTNEYQSLNPINKVKNSQNTFPILCIHGMNDGIVPVCSTMNFVEAIQNQSCHSIQVFYFHANHIEITSAWYYDETQNYGQKEILLSWLQNL